MKRCGKILVAFLALTLTFVYPSRPVLGGGIQPPPAINIVPAAPRGQFFPASAGANLVIAGRPMDLTTDNYLRFIKYLTVSPEKRRLPEFQSNDVQTIKSLESPLRRQIFEAMVNNRLEQFRFASLARAQEDFSLRVQAVMFMRKIEKGPSNGGVDFNYFTSKVPAQADPACWYNPGPGFAVFEFRTRPGIPSSASIDEITRKRFRGECLGAIEITVLQAAKKALGAARFDNLHPNGLAIAGRTSSVVRHMRRIPILSVRDLVPGDWVYMKNKDDYNTDLRAGVRKGPWTGENALYMGRYTPGSDFRFTFSRTAPQRFSGMGVYNATENSMRQAVKKGYLDLMRLPFTNQQHTINDQDVRWTQFSRLVTGM